MSHAFTIKGNGLALDLITDAHVSEAYDTKHPPNPLPIAEPVKALWDTGATHTSISVGLALKLGLVSTGQGKMEHADGETVCETYVVNLVLPNGVTISGLTVMATKLPGKCHVLIGMNVITAGDFALSHAGGKTVFSFRIPSKQSVDFVKEINRDILKTIKPNDDCTCGSQKKFKKCCQHKYL